MQAATCQSILKTCREILSATECASCPTHASVHSPNQPLPKIPALPPPTSILDVLLAQRFPMVIAREISDRFQVIAAKNHAFAQESFARVAENLPVKPGLSPEHTEAFISKLARGLQNHYEMQSSQLRQTVIDRAHQLMERLEQTDPFRPQIKRTFNQEYTPLLEKYFEYNPYPSAPDRVLLARKSMMTPRQIEVWFQNHRNRARKEGKTVLRRSPNNLSSQIPSEFLEEKMPFFVIPVQEQLEELTGSPSEAESDNGDKIASLPPPYTEVPDPFSSPAPPHAFPTTYGDSTRLPTFIPKTSHFSCDPIAWTRKPALPSRKRKTHINMDELSNDFAGRLSLCEPTPKKLKRSAKNSTSTWFAHKQTIPAPAPHPAFIRPLSYTTPSPLTSSRNPVPLQIARGCVFQSPDPDTPLLTLVPPQSGVRGSRRMARLPKRMPKYNSIAHRGISPALSSLSTSPVNSRTSSISSSSSSRRRLSSSSCSSAASSTLTTPVMMPVELPEMRASPIASEYGFEGDSYEDLFGDSGREITPPIHRHLSFSPGPRKWLFNCDFAPSPYVQTPSP